MQKIKKQKLKYDGYIKKSWYIQQETLKLEKNIKNLEKERESTLKKREQIDIVNPKLIKNLSILRNKKSNKIQEIVTLIDQIPDEDFGDSWSIPGENITVYNYLPRMYERLHENTNQEPETDQQQSKTDQQETEKIQQEKEITLLSPYSKLDKIMLNKKIRALKKKLRQIELLEQKDVNELSQQQKQKIEKKNSIIHEIKIASKYL